MIMARNTVMLNVIYAECRKQVHYAKCHRAECRGTLQRAPLKR